MAIKSGEARAARYNLKLNPTYVQEDLTAMKPDMLARMTAVANAQALREAAVKGLLAGEGLVLTISIPFYLAFANVVQSRVDKMSGGPNLVTELTAIKDFWVAQRGLVDAVAIKIVLELYGVIIV